MVDVETLTVTERATVKYCYVITNQGPDTLYDVEVVDDNGTPGDVTDDFDVTLTGLTDINGENDLGDLAAGGTATGFATIILTTDGTVPNPGIWPATSDRESSRRWCM